MLSRLTWLKRYKQEESVDTKVMFAELQTFKEQVKQHQNVLDQVLRRNSNSDCIQAVKQLKTYLDLINTDLNLRESILML